MKTGLAVFASTSFVAAVVFLLPLVSGIAANRFEARLIETRISLAGVRQESIEAPLITVHTKDDFYRILKETALMHACFFLEQTFFVAEKRTTFTPDGTKIYETGIRVVLEGNLTYVLEYLYVLSGSEVYVRELSLTGYSPAVLEAWISVFHEG